MRKILGRIVSAVIIIAALCVLGFCLSKLIPKFMEYKESDDTYKKIREVTVSQPEEEDDDSLHIDWDAWEGTDIVAWLQLGDIGYPVMQGKDNKEYLHHLPDKTYNYGGSLFLQAESSDLFLDQNEFIYGHNMSNGSMFGSLKKYTSEDFKDYTFDLYLPDGTRHTYTYFSVQSQDVSSSVFTYAFADDEAFLSYQNKMLSQSILENSAKADVSNKIVSLSTCNGPSGTSHRLIVQGVETSVRQTQGEATWYPERVRQREEEARKKAEEEAETLRKAQEEAEKQKIEAENSAEEE